MCIFSRPVISVDATRIFARLSGDGSQYLAYQMRYDSPEENAMILPIPVKQPANDQSIEFINLENYDEFFDDLDRGFPYEHRPGIACSAPDSLAKDSLKVFEVGNYIASFVPTLSDFDRLDPQFKLPNEIWQSIPGYSGFGFAVFQLAAGSLKPHPMSFKFRAARQEIFFPTIHIHDGEVHELEKFDHVLYMQHAGLDSSVYGYRNSHVEDKSTGLIRSKHKASQFIKVSKSKRLIEGDLLVHRKIVRGKLPNEDSIFTPAGHPLKRSLNFRSLLPYFPLAFAVAGIAWFFNRRSKLKRIEALRTQDTDREDTDREDAT